jgi:hypothetical protein
MLPWKQKISIKLRTIKEKAIKEAKDKIIIKKGEIKKRTYSCIRKICI